MKPILLARDIPGAGCVEKELRMSEKRHYATQDDVLGRFCAWLRGDYGGMLCRIRRITRRVAAFLFVGRVAVCGILIKFVERAVYGR